MLAEWCDNYHVQSVSEACIRGLVCTSSEALNLVFEDLGRSIDVEQGLKKLEIAGFEDQNTLEEWPLSQLVLKSHHLEQLTIIHLYFTTAANRS